MNVPLVLWSSFVSLCMLIIIAMGVLRIGDFLKDIRDALLVLIGYREVK